MRAPAGTPQISKRQPLSSPLPSSRVSAMRQMGTQRYSSFFSPASTASVASLSTGSRRRSFSLARVASAYVALRAERRSQKQT